MTNHTEHDDDEHRELTQKFMMFEQQIRLIQEQMQAVENAIIDLEGVHLGLGELVGKKDNEIMAPIGRGIYAKAKLISEDLLVDVGGKNFVKKSIPETQKVLKEQTEKLKTIKTELEGEMEKINEELTKVFMEHQKMHEHDEED
jgi:prefoldin alpha subunit